MEEEIENRWNSSKSQRNSAQPPHTDEKSNQQSNNARKVSWQCTCGECQAEKRGTEKNEKKDDFCEIVVAPKMAATKKNAFFQFLTFFATTKMRKTG
jgi:hypothetical protein